ncbi:MAG: fibronectin type III domain-containing protein [Thermoleophilia bacterium]
MFLFSAIPAILITLTALVPVFFPTGTRAQALSPSEWEILRGNINSFITSQYEPTDDGEAGFLVTAGSLKNQLDSNGDMNPATGAGVLGEGDDAALAPVLVDILGGSITWIPGTSYRIPSTDNWFGAANTANSTAIRNLVQSRHAAGFNYDIVSYCLTGHTESPVIMAYGVMGQADYFGTGESPKSLGLKWGRFGWNNGSMAYGNAKPLTMSTTAGIIGSPGGGSVACSGLVPASEMVRCTASEAMNSVNTNGGPGAGINPWTPAYDNFYAPVDIRFSSGPYMANQTTLGAYTFNAPLPELFNSTYYLSGLYVNGKTNIFVNRTQHTGLIAATGAQMLGYPSESMKWGLANWNNTLPEKFTGGAGGPLVNTPIDTTAPVVTSVSAHDITHNSVTITRQASEPATMKVEYGTVPGVYTNSVNSTVLNANKSVTVTGLNPYTTYYLRITSYDGMANGTTSVDPFGFITTTPEPDYAYRPDIVPLADPHSYWASYADYLARELSVDVQLANRGVSVAYDVQITGASNSNGVTLSSMLPVMLGNIPAGSTATATLKYHIPSGIGSMVTRLQGSASDTMGISYSYP